MSRSPGRSALAALRREHTKRKRWHEVVLRHCRPEWIGGRWMPVRCAHVRRGNVGKVIFDSQEAANRCATDLVKLDATRLRSYPCPLSGSSHFHLTKDSPAERATDHAARSEFEALKQRVGKYTAGGAA